MKTYLPKQNELKDKSKWYLIDAADKTLGKIATEAARRLTGKHRVDFTPHIDLGDTVVVINAEKVRLSGNKLKDKIYYRHSGHRGNLKETTAGELLEKDPRKVISLAVKGMLPKNKLRDTKLTRLKVFSGSEHNHSAQQPETIDLNSKNI